jgi:transcriptional regulator with XRE-family HTH domain
MSMHRRLPKGAWVKLTSADTLRALMAQRNFSMARLARYADCSKSFISHLTSGRKTTCSGPLAERIAEALDVPLGLLFVAGESADSGRSITRRETVAA